MKWTYLYIILLFLSCQTKEEENRNKVNYLFTLEKTGELKLPLDNETSYEMYYLSYYNDNSEELLYTWNHFTNGINVYSLTTKTLLNQIKIPLEGPNSIYSLQGFTVIHKDTILAYARGTTSSTIMLNTKGDILNTHFIAKDDKMPVINHLSNSQAPTLKYGKYLCFSQLPLFDLSNPANMNDKFPFEIWYDLEANHHIDMGIHFPESYQNKLWGIYNVFLSRTKGHDNYFVYSWPAKEEIYITDFEGNDKWVNISLDKAKGKYSKALPMNYTKDEQLKAVTENYSHRTIFYDKYREVYYQMVLGPTDKLIANDYNAFFAQPMYFVILNKNFEKIGEVRMPSNKYSFMGLFIGKEGLYIPQTNTENPELKEDEITFSIYKLEKQDEK